MKSVTACLRLIRGCNYCHLAAEDIFYLDCEELLIPNKSYGFLLN